MRTSAEVQISPPKLKKPLASIRTLLIWLVLATFLPALIGSYVLIFHVYQDGRAQLEKETLQTARALVQAVDAKLAQAELLAQTLATTETLARHDFPSFHRWTQGILQKSDIVKNIVIYDESGQQLVNSRLSFGEPLPRRTDLTQIQRVFSTGRPVASGVFVSPLTGLPVISVAVPVFSGSKVVYSLAVGIAPQQFSNILKKQNLQPDWVVSVLDAKGTIAARTHSADKFVGKKAVPVLLKYLLDAPEGVQEILTHEGILTVTPYSRSPDSGWSVTIGIPRQSLEAHLMRTVALLGSGAALLLGLSMGLAGIIGHRINHSMRSLRSAAIELGAGELVTMPQMHLREVDEVAQTMTRAAHLLKARTRALETTYETLVTREAELADAQRIAKIGSWSWNARTDVTASSVELCRIFGLPSMAPFAQQDGVMFPHPVWRELSEARQQAIQTGSGYDLELPALRADGRHFWVNIRSEAVHDAHGEVIGLQGMVQDITDRKQAESIAQSERFITTITDAMPDLVAYFDRDLRCRFANQSYLAWYGKPAQAIMGATLMELLGASLFAVNEPFIRAALAGEKQQFERFLTRPDGSVGHVFAKYIPDIDRYGHVVGFIVIVADIRALKLAEAEIKLGTSIYQNTSDAIMVTDVNGIILSVNPAFTAITGYPAQEAIGQTPRLLRSNRHDDEFHAAVWRGIAEHGQWKVELWNRRKNGEAFMVSQTITRIAGAGQESSRNISVFHDITENWQKNENHRRLAFHDALTDLPNRALLLERLNYQIIMAQRAPRSLAIMFLDLDGFKSVNDNLGHEIGDGLLIVVAKKLQALLRQSDTVARFGGDEFIILLGSPASHDDVVQIANRVIAVIHEPVNLDGKMTHVGASIGIAMFPEDGISASELLKSADTAMYEAKRSGKNRYQFSVPAARLGTEVQG